MSRNDLEDGSQSTRGGTLGLLDLGLWLVANYEARRAVRTMRCWAASRSWKPKQQKETNTEGRNHRLLTKNDRHPTRKGFSEGESPGRQKKWALCGRRWRGLFDMSTQISQNCKPGNAGMHSPALPSVAGRADNGRSSADFNPTSDGPWPRRAAALQDKGRRPRRGLHPSSALREVRHFGALVETVATTRM